MRSKNILIVDDEEGPREMMVDITNTSKLNLKPFKASSENEAVIKSAAISYDLGLVIVDGLYGKCFRLAEIIKENNPETKVMLWTTDQRILDQMPHDSIDGILPKPMRLQQYTDFLEELYK